MEVGSINSYLNSKRMDPFNTGTMQMSSNMENLFTYCTFFSFFHLRSTTCLAFHGILFFPFDSILCFSTSLYGILAFYSFTDLCTLRIFLIFIESMACLERPYS